MTPYSVIEKIVADLIEYKPCLKCMKWVDPCAGDGRWEEVIKSYDIAVESYDLKPLKPEIRQNDFLDNKANLDYCFIIGNPPYSKINQFVKESFKHTNLCYFLGGSARLSGVISSKVEMLNVFLGYEGKQKDRRSKIKFDDTLGEEVLVWSCGALFSKDEEFSKFKDGDYYRVSINKRIARDRRIREIEN